MRVIYIGKEGLTASAGVTRVVLENDVVQVHHEGSDDWYDLVVDQGWFEDRDYFLGELHDELKSEIVDLTRFAVSPGATISAHL